LVRFTGLGITYQQKSGNPASAHHSCALLSKEAFTYNEAISGSVVRLRQSHIKIAPPPARPPYAIVPKNCGLKSGVDYVVRQFPESNFSK
jgi:hypothetical protein